MFFEDFLVVAKKILKKKYNENAKIQKCQKMLKNHFFTKIKNFEEKILLQKKIIFFS